MERAYKFRIYPNKTQESLLQKTFGCVRFIYNHFLDKRIKAYEQNKKTISYNECSKELTQLKKEKKWLKEPDKSSLNGKLGRLQLRFGIHDDHGRNDVHTGFSRNLFYGSAKMCVRNL